MLTADECSTSMECLPTSKIGDKVFSTERGTSIRDVIQKGLVERDNWKGHLASPYDFPLSL